MHGLNCRRVEIAELTGQRTLKSLGGEIMWGINNFKNATPASRVRKTERAAGSDLEGQLSFPSVSRQTVTDGGRRCS